MNKFVLRTTLVCAASLFSIVPASAQLKIGIVNIQRAIIETTEIKKAQVALETKYKPRQAELEKMQKELADLQAQLQSGKLNPQAEQELTARGQRRQREAQRMSEDLQGDVDRERNDVLQKAGQRMSDVIKKIAEEKGLDVVVDVSTTLYFKPALDITPEAIAGFNKAYPAQ
jgi:outer membrane protein